MAYPPLEPTETEPEVALPKINTVMTKLRVILRWRASVGTPYSFSGVSFAEGLGMKILGERLFTIVFFAAVVFTVYSVLHFLTGWSPSLRR